MEQTALTEEKGKLKKVAGITLFESSVQWYCFLLYGSAAGTVFNKVFFSQVSNPTTALLLSYLTFAVGYIGGPFGAVFFGHLGDKKGRKATMYASLLMMGISTSIIGLLPPVAMAGVWVAFVLQLMRLGQGFGRGGTWGGGILMAYENVPEDKRAFYAAIPQLGMPIGLGLASIVIAVPSALLPEEDFLAWGWRIAFLFAIVLTLIVVRMKGHMMETDDYKKAQAKLEAAEAEGKKHKVGFSSMVKDYWRTLLLGCGTRWVDGTFYNVFIVWIMSYCTGWLGMPLSATYTITIAVCICEMPFTLFGGWCAGKIGKTRTFVLGSTLAAVLSIPTLKMIELANGNVFLTALCIIVGWSFAYNMIWSVLSSLWSSYFETEVRYSGISFVYHVPSFLVAGLVPTICTLLINYGNGNTIYVGIYSTIVALISVFCALELKRRHERGKK